MKHYTLLFGGWGEYSYFYKIWYLRYNGFIILNIFIRIFWIFCLNSNIINIGKYNPHKKPSLAFSIMFENLEGSWTKDFVNCCVKKNTDTERKTSFIIILWYYFSESLGTVKMAHSKRMGRKCSVFTQWNTVVKSK